MKQLLYTIPFVIAGLFFYTIAFSQFKESNNDGFTSSLYNRQNTTDAVAFKGSSNDDFTNTVFNKQNNTQLNCTK